VTDNRREAREAMLKAQPGLENMYKLDDGIFEVLYFTDATATISNIKGGKEVVEL
jgi:uncharacterized pyridoxamine 5'-phosphate oxidase family protein